MRRWVFCLVVAMGCRKSAPPQPSSAASSTPQVKAEPVKPVAPAVVRTVASGQAHPWNVYVDDKFVYWANKGKKRTSSGGVFFVPKAGGPIQTVVSDAASPYGLAVGNGLVFFTEAVAEGNGVGAWGAGGSPFTRAKPEGPHEPWAIVAKGDRIVWNDLLARDIETTRVVHGGQINLAPIDVLAKTTGRPVGLAMDDTHVYFTDSDPGVVARVPIAGGPVETLVTGGDKTTGLAIDDTHVYFGEWGSGKIAKVPKAGGAVVLLASDQKGVRNLAVDRERVYFNHPPSGSVRSVSKSGGAVQTHVTGEKQPYSIAVDDTSIYWANVDGDSVRAIAK